MFSAVFKEGVIQLRARNPQHLEALIRAHGQDWWVITETDDTDYPWRIYLSQKDWEQLATALAAEIDWSNFKLECSRSRVDWQYLDAIHDIWWRMLEYQKKLFGRGMYVAEPRQAQLPLEPSWVDMPWVRKKKRNRRRKA